MFGAYTNSDTSLLDAISNLLKSTDFRVLSRDGNTLYVEDTESGEHFSIRVQECSD